ncbi:YqeG family HAD IIIA-type phosphatase [Fundicoccus culcitae]|uniref:YqeG family HAD IIIA-type phosphatase n=1 Tax=Fundicoccus culcitae TaxID=2969821 RepID=A0ABY5P627_9LACT|nr:YqeG family HAD IIIA-type phosphatase [Fundicoccus culcitae]UUX34196.1 YqeG family HAD IIIA-type phosphatase [Fundicoccus culcitae]
MKKYFTPNWKINSIYNITAEDLLNHGYRAVIIDLDNTLLAWNQADHTVEMAEWMEEISQAQIKVYILSNNKLQRVARVAEPLKIQYSANAMKPFKKSFKKAVDHLAVPNEEIVVIGDQLMTDVFGANRFGLDSILVRPIASNDIIYTRLNRLLEKIIFKCVGIDRHADWGETLDD